MAQNLRIDGIYDQRTLKLLKSKGVKDFGFNFSPKSFNFIQEHVFLNELVILLDPSDRINLHFARSNDPMITKVFHDLIKCGVAKEQVFIHCDEWIAGAHEMGINYYLHYHLGMDFSQCSSAYFSGIIFDFSFFADLQSRGVLNNFITNFYTHFKNYLTDATKIVLKIEWNDNVFPSLFDYFDIDVMTFSINSNMEVCYRNVDLKKLTNEIELIEKASKSISNF